MVIIWLPHGGDVVAIWLQYGCSMFVVLFGCNMDCNSLSIGTVYIAATFYQMVEAWMRCGCDVDVINGICDMFAI